MKNALWLSIALCIATVALSAQSIEYFVEKPADSFYTSLHARANGKTYTLIDKSKEQCLAVTDQRDWDGNRLKDALVERITACGGNCCPNSYFFVSAFPNGRFEVSEELADSWGEPVIEKWQNAWSVVLVSTNEGFNTDAPKEITRRFVLRNGKGVKVSESLRKSVDSILEMRSEMFTDPNQERTLEYDLDRDGKKDVIGGKLWERWGRIFWTVRFANGKEFKTDVAYKRIGVLKTVSKGVHDLVCDQDTIYRWTGDTYAIGDTTYESPAASKPSFDCAKATTPVERHICRDPGLAALEAQMVAAYRQALGRLSGAGQTAFRRDHAAWLKNYSNTCNASANDQDRAGCISRHLTEHTAELARRR